MKNQRPGKSPVVRVFWTSAPPQDHRKRIAYTLALSLAIHALIMSLQFGALGFGLPGLAMPWEERRMQASELNVRLVEAPRPPAPAPAPVAEPLRLALTPDLSKIPAESPKPSAPARAEGSFEVVVPQAPAPAPLAEPQREARKPAPAAKARARDRKMKAKPRPPILAQRDPQEETFNVPQPKRAQPEPQRAPESAAKKQTEEPRPDVQAAEAARRQAEEAARLEAEAAAARQRAEEEARQRALALQKELEEQAQAEARRLEEQKQEEARRLALEAETRKLAEEAARQEAEKLALQRALELRKEEEAKEDEAKRLALEAERKSAEDAARELAAARQKALEAKRLAEETAARAKEAAERKRAEAEAAAKGERDRLAAQKKVPASAPGALSGTELAAKALEQLRTPGAARDDVLRPAPPPRAESPRRRSLFGVERDVGLRMYVESFRWKIERHGALNYRPSASWRARDNPVVTVSIRSDGSLEDVVIHRSSGVRELDEAVQRIARLHAPYSKFPPALATRYDVIEIRRVWSFDDTLRILDEM